MRTRTIRHGARRVLAAVTLIAVLVGPPLVIGVLIGSPIPAGAHIATLTRTGTLDADTALRLGAGLFYAVWVAVALITMAEVARVMKVRDRATDLPIIDAPWWSPAGGLRRLARVALVASVTAASSTSMHTLSPAAALPRPAVAAPADAVATLSTHTWTSSGRCTPLSVSIDVYGHDGHRAQIAEVNRGRHTPSGNPWLGGPFPAGMTVALPADLPLPEHIEMELLAHTEPTTTQPESTTTVALPQPSHTITIHHGDNLWTLAKRELDRADGPDTTPAARDIAAYTHEVIDVNTDVFVEPHNPGLIFAGQQFTFPAIGIPTPADTTAPLPPPQPEPSPTPNVSLPSPSLTPPPPATPAPTAAPSSIGLSPPTVGASVTSVTSSASATPTDAPTVDDTTRSDDGTTAGIATRIGWVGSATLAAGVLALAAKLRRRSRQVRRPTQPVHELDLAFRTTLTGPSPGWAAGVLRQLSRHRHPIPGSSGAVPQCVRVDGDTLEILWDLACPELLQGWTTSDGGWTWRYTHDPAVVVDRSSPAPCPTLVTIGRHEGAEVLVNLEAAAVLTVVGDGDCATDQVRAFALELATSPFMDVATILFCAFPIDGIDRHEWVESVTVTEAIVRARQRADAMQRLLAKRRVGSLFELRGAGGDADALEPVVVIVDANRCDPGELDELLSVAGPGAIAIVIEPVQEATTGWVLTTSNNTATLTPLGLTVTPVGVSAPIAARIATLLDHASGDTDVEPDDVGVDAVHHIGEVDDEAFVSADPDSIRSFEYGIAWPVSDPNDFTTPNAASDEDADDDDADIDSGNVDSCGAVVVRLLGDIDVDGANEDLRPKELEVVVYLTMHRNGATADMIRTMVWPEGISDQRWRNISAVVRRKLGNDDTNPRFSTRDPPGRYRIASSVVTDWDKFLGYARTADEVPSAEATTWYRHALELVTGPPFAGVASGYSWAFSDGTVTEMVDTIKHVAATAAELWLDAGDARSALWAVIRGQRAVGTRIDAQRLTYLEMLSHLDSGSPNAAINVYRALQAELDEIDPGLEPDNEIVSLYQDLIRQRRAV